MAQGRDPQPNRGGDLGQPRLLAGDMKRIAFMNQKGGAAKSTLCVHLATACHQSGKRSVIIDTDPQGSAHRVWGVARAQQEPFVGTVVPSDVERAITAAAADGYDFAFVDTAPHTAPALQIVAKAVDLVVIPVQPSVLDVAATAPTVALLRATGVPLMAVMSRAPAKSDEETRETEEALAAMGLPLAPVRMTDRKAYRRALTRGQAVNEFEPKGKAAEEIRAIWAEILKHPVISQRSRKKA